MKKVWKVKELGTLLTVQNGFAFNAKLFGTNGIQLIRIRDLKNGMVTETKYSGKYDKLYLVRKGDFLIGMDGEFKCFEWHGEDSLLNQRVCRLQINNKLISPHYIFYSINDHLKKIEEATSYTTVKHISSKQILKITIPLPPLAEQKLIVAILDEAFAAIAKARENAEKNLANAREVFESYLNSVFSNPGEGWEEKRLDNLAKIINGYSFSSKDFSPTNKTKSIKITNVGVKEFVYDSENYLPLQYSESYKDFQVKKGDIVIALTRTIISSGLKVAIVPEAYTGALVNQRVAAIVPNIRYINQNYLYHFLCTKIVLKYVQKNVNTLMQPNLSLFDLKKLLIPLPALKEQHSIMAKLDSLSAETTRLEAIYHQKLAALDELKESILDKAFKGELTADSVYTDAYAKKR